MASQPKPITVEPFADDVPLRGEGAPHATQIDDLIRILATISHRFGNTAVKYSISWGANEHWAAGRDREAMRQAIEILTKAVE